MIVFVFGSNLAGIHGAGAAYDALQYWGAQWAIAQGRKGDSYAIPTKNFNVRDSLPLSEIASAISDFVVYAKKHPEIDFQVTRIGCGFAGYKDEQIAPFFRHAPENTHLPLGWRELL